MNKDNPPNYAQMKLKLSIITFIFLLFSNGILADGAPMDSTGKIFTKYVSITLDSIQIKHLQKNRYLKLTDEQQKRLHYLDLPKYVDIIDPFHRRMCTCGQIYGMWYAPDKVAFTVKDTTVIYKHESDDPFFDVYDKNFDTNYKQNEMFIGSKGELYYKGKLVSLNDVVAILNLLENKKSYIRIFLPPINKQNYTAISNTRQALSQIIPSEFNFYWN